MYRAIIKLKDKKIKTDLKGLSSLSTTCEVNNKSTLNTSEIRYDADDNEYYDEDKYEYYSTTIDELFKKNKEIKIKIKKDLNGCYQSTIKVLGKKIKTELIELTITIFKRYKYYYYEDGRVMVKDRPLQKQLSE